MGYWPESTKQLRNKRVISLSLVCVLIFCFFQLISDRDEPKVHSRIDMNYFNSPTPSKLHGKPVEENYLDVEFTVNDNLAVAVINKVGDNSSSDINENTKNDNLTVAMINKLGDNRASDVDENTANDNLSVATINKLGDNSSSDINETTQNDNVTLAMSNELGDNRSSDIIESTMNDNLTAAMANKLGDNGSSDINEQSSNSGDQDSHVVEDEKAETGPKCDIYLGKWVRDGSYPLYRAGECPYISGAFNCKENGRLDSDYTKWRWQPRDCNIPRFNATDMLERLRGKRLMFVGDSINRNQWESMLCILRTALPENSTHFSSKGAITAFLAQDYNCSVEFFWAPFLIQQGNAVVRNTTKQILLLDKIENHGNYWKDVDILAFNSAHWWTHGNKVSSRDFYQEGNYLYPELDPMTAFKKGLTTWANWIDSNIHPNRTKVFFRGFSPMHFSSSQWNKPKGHKCNYETQPILNENYINPYPERMKLADEVVGQMRFPVSMINITTLSDFRKDAHPSVYTLRHNKKLTQEQRNNPDSFGDCSHWCLPGLPDIWNELLYGSIVMQSKTSSFFSHS